MNSTGLKYLELVLNLKLDSRMQAETASLNCTQVLAATFEYPPT